MKIQELHQRIEREGNSENKDILQRFFKTGIGEYGESDIFIGIKVPVLRKISKEYKDIEFNEILSLLESEIHEKRLVGIFILTHHYNRAKKEKNIEKEKKCIDLYLSCVKKNYINNWDLVDLSAAKLLGDYLIDKDRDRDILYKLSKSDNLWEKRVSIISTFAFIRINDFKDAIKISEILLKDSHDLIHKAVGWMLREVGKKDKTVLEDYLKIHYKKMPRTMLRYAIERFEEKLRKKYLKGEI